MLKTEVIDSGYIQVDETTLPVIDKEKRKADQENISSEERAVMRQQFARPIIEALEV